MILAMNAWRRFNARGWFVRWPVKGLILAVTAFLVCFPYPRTFVRHVQRWRNPNGVVEPDAALLVPWVAEVRGRIQPQMQPPQVLHEVEQFVYQKVPYQWDWVNWGVADYLPTVDEVIQKGSEDCDGRAVIAASILRKLGFRADLVTDFAHMWVRTDRGETMNPGRPPAIVAQERGFKIDLSALTELIPAAAYGLAPFPLVREFIVLGTLWLLLLMPGMGRSTALLGLIALVDGLLLMRIGGEAWKHPIVWMQWVGTVSIVGGATLLFARGIAARRTRLDASAVAPAASPA